MHENFTIFTRRLPPLHGEEYSRWMKIGCEVGELSPTNVRSRHSSCECVVHHTDVAEPHLVLSHIS